jgi:hypothetical protein
MALTGCRTPAPTEPSQPGDDTGVSVESVPGVTGHAPWLRSETRAPGSVTFTELHYNPGQEGEWLELHNPMALDMDVSQWSLQGDVALTFAEGTVIPAGGYVVVAADGGGLGPYTGELDDDGGRVELRSNSGRLIDVVRFGQDAPWPVHPDGSGLTLSKRAPTLASDHAENWTHSAQIGGTPGADNGLDPNARSTRVALIDDDAAWLYAENDGQLGDWTALDFDDSAWAAGQGPIVAGGSDAPVMATAWATADNYFALYLGPADGSALRLVGQDSDGSWTTVEEISFEVDPLDHLYAAAWELTGDSGSPQMFIAEVEAGEVVVGTDAAGWEWTLGDVDANPGGLPANPPPDAAALEVLVHDAAGTWQSPQAQASRSASPWGSRVGGSFSDAAAFVWADTFANESVTNTDDTFVLFRSVDPLLGDRGTVELDGVPTALALRTHFDFAGDPDATTLHLDCALDDGAVFWLNGQEVLRDNVPAGAVDETTLASAAVDDAELFAEISSGALVQGGNVLAVSLHQADDPDPDLLLDCGLRAVIRSVEGAPTLAFNEVSGAQDGWVELVNHSPVDQALDGLVLRSADGEGLALASGDLAPGELLVVDVDLALGEPLVLASPDAVLDVVRVASRARARTDEGWRTPSEETPGAANVVDGVDQVVINEVQYHFGEHEWIELFNRGDEPVDLSGWQLVDAVAYPFADGTELDGGGYLVIAGDPAAVLDLHPDIDVVGPFVGGLSNGSDRVVLLDELGNPADHVRYHDGGRWPKAADGGGASLELQDPWADNAVAGAWAASETGSEWVQVRFRGTVDPSAVGPDGVWEEFVVGLLDAGEVWIDDVSVIQDPDTDPVELIQDGSFDDASAWRVLGNHGESTVVADADGNAVLRVRASGGTGHMHNHIETTLTQPVAQRTVEVSFRARWVWGSNQLNTRLYFNRLPRTTLLERPQVSGTPGAPNSTRVDNLGPTLSDLSQDVVMPAAMEPVVISVVADDPDGLDGLTLWSSVDGGAWGAVEMQAQGAVWRAALDGQPAGSVVQFYVHAVDALGAASTLPADGPDAAALVGVDDGYATDNGRHTLRIVMAPDDVAWLHDELNLMSDGRVGATVVYDEAQVFYDVGVRLKGSQRGRPQAARIGYGVRFNDDEPFRGSHTSVLIDRSEGVGYGQREVLLNLMMTRSGSVTGEHNDVIQLLGPTAATNGSAELQLDRFSNLVLGAQFQDGAQGTRFEYELIYYPTTTHDGTAEGFKRPQPDSVLGTPITDLGDDPEAYRWVFLIKNNKDADRYDEIVDLGQTFALSGDAFWEQVPLVIDVEQWLRAYAFATLSGATDQYGGAGSQHNAQLYVRPVDGRVLYLPHDLDFFSSSSMPVVGNADLARLLQDPENLRSYYGHLDDILETSYSSAYLGPWCDQLGDLLPGQDFDAHCAFVDARADWVRSGSSESIDAVFPWVDFGITTNGGADFGVSEAQVTLQGQAWVDVRGISLDGQALDVVWVGADSWQVDVVLEPGVNEVELVAVDLQGQVVGSDVVVVTRE